MVFSDRESYLSGHIETYSIIENIAWFLLINPLFFIISGHNPYTLPVGYPKKDKRILSFVFTIIVISIIIFSGPASAISVGLYLQESIEGSYKYRMVVDIHTDDHVPLDFIAFHLENQNDSSNYYCYFDFNTLHYNTTINGDLQPCRMISITRVVNNATFEGGYGYAFGYGVYGNDSNLSSQNVSWNPDGYGYTSGYGYSAYNETAGMNGEITIEFTVNTTIENGPGQGYEFKIMSGISGQEEGDIKYTYYSLTQEQFTTQGNPGDETHPQIDINSPSSNSVIASRILEINLTASDTDFNYTNISITNSTGVIVNSTIDSTNGTYLISLSVPEDGVYNITATAYDKSNNANSTEVSNLTVITLNVTLDSPNDFSGDSDGNIAFQYNVSGGSGEVNCSLIINGSNNATDASVSKDIPQNFSSSNFSKGEYAWSINCSDSLGISVQPSVRYLAVIRATTFGGQTTDLSSVNTAEIANLTLESEGYGKIIFNEPVNLSGGVDLDSLIDISNNSISVDSLAEPRLNKSATLYFYNLEYNQTPVILRDGLICSDCTAVSYGGQNMTVNVTGFTSYSAGSNANLTIWDGSDAEGGNNTIEEYDVASFFANYTNRTDGQPINGTGVYCNITFNVSGGWADWEEMAYNDTSGLYEYNRSFSLQENISWNVSCDGSSQGYEPLNASDNISISPRPSEFEINTMLPENNTYSSDNTTDYAFNVTGLETDYNCTLWYNDSEKGSNESVLNNTFTIITAQETTDGNYSWKINCTYGEAANESHERIVVIDTISPVISINSPAPSFISNIREVEINLTVTEVNLNYTNISIINSTGSAVNTTLNATNGTYVVELAALVDGIYSLTAAAYDLAGNINQSMAQNITLDTIPPQVSITSPINDTYTNQTLFDISYLVTESNMNLTNISITNSSGSVVNSTTNISTGSVHSYLSVYLDGSYNITATSYDLAGNSNQTLSQNITLDTTLPTFLNHRRNPITPTEEDDLQVNVTLSEINPDTVTLEWNNSVNYTVSTYQGDEYYFTIEKSNYTAHDNLTYYWYANDTSGNLNRSDQQSFTVTNQIPSATAPEVSNTTPRTNDILSCLGGIFSDEDNEDAELSREYRWYDSGGEVIDETALTIDLSLMGLDKEDNITCSIRVSDGYGWSEWVNSSNTAVIENTPPTVPVEIASEGPVRIDEIINATASGSTDADNDSIIYYYEFFNANDSAMIQGYSANNLYQISLSDVHDEIRVRAKVGDGSDNSSEIELNISVLDTAPEDPTDIAGFAPSLKVGENLAINASGGIDADNDTIEYYYKFFNEDDNATGQDWSVDNTYIILVTDAHDTIKVLAKSVTEYGNSTGDYNETDMVEDTLPTEPSQLNLTESANVLQNITANCIGSFDADNDTITYYYEFYNLNDTDTKQIYSESKTYTLNLSDAHDTIRVRCKATTSYGNSSDVEQNLSISDTLPTDPTGSSLSAGPLVVGDILTAEANGSFDADNDTITYYYEFYDLNDSTTKQAYSTNNTYLVQLTDAHDILRVYSKAVTSFGNSTEYYLEDFVDNSIPGTPSTMALNLTARVGQDIVVDCTGSFDADNDTITYYYEFYDLNDSTTKQAYLTNSSYLAETSDAHDQIRVRCKSSDGQANSTETEGNSSVTDTPPTDPTGSNLTSGIVMVGNNLTAEANGSTDSDNDTIIYYYQFYNVNDSLVVQTNSTNSTYRANRSDEYDTIRVRIWASTFYGDSAGYEELNKSITDSTSPQTTINSPQASSILANRTISVNLTVAEINLNYTNISILNSTGYAVNSTINISNGTYMASLSVPYDGVFSINATSYDIYHNVNSTVILNVTVDTQVPSISQIALSDSSPLKAGNVTFTLDFSESMNQSINPTVKIKNSSEYTITGLGWTNSTRWTGGYNFTISTGDGNYTINITGAKDLVGNQINENLANSFLLDTISPNTSASAVLANGSVYVFNEVTNSSYVNVTLLCSDASGSGCQITVYCLDTNDACAPNQTYLGEVQILSEGVSYIRYASNDTSGNNEDLISQAVRIDQLPPSMNFTYPTELNASRVPHNWSLLNITVTEEDLKELRLNWNGTNYTLYDDSLVLLMNFNNNPYIGENQSLCVDNSRYANNGVISNNVSWTSSGRFGNALNFGGTNGSVIVPDSSSINLIQGISIELWAKGSSGGLLAAKRTTSTYDKYSPQEQVVGDKIYYIWREYDGAYSQIWTSVMNTDGTGWNATKRTNSTYNKDMSQEQIVGDKIYYVWKESDGTNYQLWTAVMNTDGTGWNATKRTNSTYNKDMPQEQIVGDKIYYAWSEIDGTNYQIWTGSMNIDGSNWTGVGETTSPFSKLDPQLQAADGKLYYLWSEIDGAGKYQIWTGSMNLDGSNWSMTKRTTSPYSKDTSQQQVVGDKIYYVWREFDGIYRQIWTGSMNLDGSNWTATNRTSSAYNKDTPQLQVIGNKIIYAWNEYNGTSYQIWTGAMNRDGTNWSAAQRTFSSYEYKLYTQLQSVGGKVYYVWVEADGSNTYQIWTAQINSNIVNKGDAYGIGIEGSTVSAFINEGLDIWKYHVNGTNNTAGAAAYSGIDSGWNYIAMTYDKSSLKLYINGEVMNSTAFTETISENPFNLVIGDAFNGTIDELRIYNRSLPQEDIKLNYLSELSRHNQTEYRYYLNKSELFEGEYAYSMLATDMSGNSKLTDEGIPRYLTIDTVSPVLMMLNLSDPSPVKAGNVTFTLDFSEGMNQSVNTTIQIKNTSTYDITPLGWLNSTRWLGWYNFTTLTGDENYTINVTGAKDLAGNQITPNTANSFLLDASLPAFSDYKLSPSQPNEDQDVQVNVTLSETNKDTLTLEWNGTMNYTITNHSGNEYYFTIDKSNYTAHDNLTYLWYANDTAGNLNSSAQQSFIVANRAPTVTAPIISNLTPRTNDVLTCTGGAFSDLDNEDIEQSRQFKWYQGNNEIINQSNQTLDLASPGLAKGNIIICSLRAYDGYNYSSWTNSSNSATIQNTPPVITTDLNNASVNTSSLWNYDFNATDADAEEGAENLTWYDNTSLFDINASTGEIQDYPSEAEQGSYQIKVTVSDGQFNDSQIFNYTIIDTTAPSVIISFPAAADYNFTNLTFNTSISDFNNVSECSYSMHNRVINSTFNCSSASINLSEGNYTLKIWANDSSGNINLTENVTFGIDVTEPDVTFSCSSNRVVKGAGLLCTCSAIDNIAASGDLSLSYDAYPSTGSKGTYTVYCMATDLAGNTGNDSFSYTVIPATNDILGGGGGGGGGGGSTGPTGTDRFISNIGNSSKSIEIYTVQKMTDTSVKFEEVVSVPFSEPEGEVYGYFKLSLLGFGSEAIKNSTIWFEVENEWLTSNNFTRVHLDQSDGLVWTELDTQYVRAANNHTYYAAYGGKAEYYSIIGEVSGLCVNLARKCQGSVLKECTNGTWSVLRNCMIGCDKTSLNCILENEGSEFCVRGEKRCLGNDSQRCVGGIWTTNETCLFGCSNETNLCLQGNLTESREENGHADTMIILSLIMIFILIITGAASYGYLGKKIKKSASSPHGEIDDYLDKERKPGRHANLDSNGQRSGYNNKSVIWTEEDEKSWAQMQGAVTGAEGFQTTPPADNPENRAKKSKRQEI